jgi:hypothetical protein
MAMTLTEIVGFTNQVVQLFEENKDDLRAKGLDVASWIPDLTAKNTDLVTKDAEQDEIKVALKVKTAEVKAATNLTYKTASTHLDAVIGVLGKSTPLAKQASRLRSSINRKNKQPTTDKSK